MPANPTYSPEPSALHRVASHALQSKNIRIEKLNDYLYRTYRLTTSKGFFYVLKCRPSPNIRLLRHEEGRLENEACALQHLPQWIQSISTRIIEYQSTSIPLGCRYLITGPLSGEILADVEPNLSRQALANIDKSLGRVVKSLCSIRGQAFGPLRQMPGLGSSWAKTFESMLEGVLRDAEDALINLPYEEIRQLPRKHRSSLDKWTQPVFVLLELSADENVVVDTRSHRVTGLLDYSTGFWGDPFMSDCFYKPTASFAEGFGRLPNGDADERIRQYLYVLFHSLLAVVRHSYRPPEERDDELEARRDLIVAIRQLAALVR